MVAVEPATHRQDGLFGPGEGASGLDLPPGFAEVALRERGNAAAHAAAIAPEAGAGTLVWVRRFDVAEFAVVLEPEEALGPARRALYLLQVALGDALAAAMPPEKPLRFVWPDTILLDRAIIGGVSLIAPPGLAEAAVPPWLVVAGMVRTAVRADSAGGLFVVGSSLEVEGFEAPAPATLIGATARHLLVHVHLWQTEGFPKLGEQYLARLEPAAGSAPGTRFGLDVQGDLLIRAPGPGPGARPPERWALAPRLDEAPAWLDPATGMPRL